MSACSAACNCSSYTLSMRFSLRFFRSCSSSSVMSIGVLIEQQKVVARHTAQNHPFHAVKVVETVLAGFANRGQKRLARIFLEQTQQLPQGQRHHFAALVD